MASRVFITERINFKKGHLSMNMVKCIERLKMGSWSISKLQEIDCKRRIKELSVSRLMDLRQVQDGAVTYLDTDGFNGRYLLSCCNSGSIFIHDLANESGGLRYECEAITGCSPGHADYNNVRLETAQWYPFDTGLFTTSGGNTCLRVWDGNQLRVIETIDVKETINRHHMSPVPSKSSCLVVVATDSREVYLADIRTGNSVRELRGHKDGVTACAFSPRDTDCLVTGGVDGRVLLWDVRMSRGHLAQMPCDEPLMRNSVKGVCFSGDGRQVIIATKGGRVQSWELMGSLGGVVRDFDDGAVVRGQMHVRRLVQMDISADSGILFVPDKCAVSIYSLKSGRILKVLNEHYGLVNCCRFNPFSLELYSGGTDQIIVPYRAEAEMSRGFTVDLERDDCKPRMKVEVDKERKKTATKVTENSLWLDTDSDDDQL